MDASKSPDSTPAKEQTAENDGVNTEVIIMGPPPLPPVIKRQKNRKNLNKKHYDETTNSSTMNVRSTSDSLNSLASPAERSVMQDKDFKRPGTSATMDMPSAPAATARQPISNKESDKTVNSQQETERNPQGLTPMSVHLKRLIESYKEKLAALQGELKRVQNIEVDPED